MEEEEQGWRAAEGKSEKKLKIKFMNICMLASVFIWNTQNLYDTNGSEAEEKETKTK